MQSIETMHSALTPVFERYNVEKVFVTGLDNDAALNLYIVGCPRARLPQMQEEISSALLRLTGIVLTYIEAEMMIDSQLFQNGSLLYEKKCT